MRPLIVIAAAVLLAFTLSAAGAQTPIPLPKKPNFAPLAFFEGTWSCTTQSSRRSEPTSTTVTYALDSTGYWLVGKSTNKATSWNPHASEGVDMIGYDYDTHKWIDVYTDNLGNYDLGTSTGMHNHAIVWHSRAFTPTEDMESVTDQTIEKVNDHKTTMHYNFMSKGHRVTVAGVCSKQQ